MAPDAQQNPSDAHEPTIPLANDGPEADWIGKACPPLDIKAGYERYLDFNEIGTGGVGCVRSCVDPNLNRRVALKFLKPELQGNCSQRIRFVREAQVLAQLEHPNIVPVHELGVRPDGGIYFTMKKLDGISLKDVLGRLKDGDPVICRDYTRARLLDVLTHTTEALAFAHSKGIIHRDLKPDNILMGQFGEVIVIDWGLAKILGQDQDHPGDNAFDRVIKADATVDGKVSGTPLYMAPEQAQGKTRELDGRCDIYSLGAILYEMLTLCRVISGVTLHEVLHNVVEVSPVPPRKRAPHAHIPRELDAIVMKALSKSPGDRHQTVKKFWEDLVAYRHGLPVSCCRPSIWQRLRKRFQAPSPLDMR